MGTRASDVAYLGAKFSFELKIRTDKIGGNRTEITNKRLIRKNQPLQILLGNEE